MQIFQQLKGSSLADARMRDLQNEKIHRGIRLYSSTGQRSSLPTLKKKNQ